MQRTRTSRALKTLERKYLTRPTDQLKTSKKPYYDLLPVPVIMLELNGRKCGRPPERKIILPAGLWPR